MQKDDGLIPFGHGDAVIGGAGQDVGKFRQFMVMRGEQRSAVETRVVVQIFDDGPRNG